MKKPQDDKVKKTILIVEDQEISRIQLKEIFAKDYNILEAEDGFEAMKILEKEKYTQRVYLVILDLIMPKMSGFEVLENMKNDLVFSEIPVIVVTSRNDVESEIEALNKGASDLIIKPYNPRVVYYRVVNAINKRELSEDRLENVLQKEQSFVNSELSYKSTHDELTGIANRISFYEKTKLLLKQNPQKKFILVRTNIERFKVINDLFGTTVGDIILKDVANVIQSIFSDKGTFGRLGSDHFAVCFDSELITIDRIRKEIDEAIQSHNLNYTLQVNLGVYEITDKNIPVDQMCDRANLALQTIKGNYLKQVAFYDATLRNTLLQEQELVSEMKDALQKNQFVIYLQPVYSLFEEKIVSAEALVRWMHPEKGLIAPGGFIPFFEKNGFIAKLDYYVWEQVCKYQQTRLNRDLSMIPISMNISRMSLYNPHLCNDIIKLVEKYQVPPELIKLEITESAYTDNPDQLLCTMKSLQDYGFVIMMDDFGSGYSSLNMLKDVPVNILKIDMCFLTGFDKTAKAGNILTSVVRMAKWLNIPVVAEGVETQSQIDFLREIGCDYIQGYYFSRPIPTDDFEVLTKQNIDYHKTVKPVFEDVAVFDSLFNSNELVSRLFNSFVGAVGIYEFSENRLEVIRVNDNYYDMMNYTPQTFHANKMNLFEMVVPDDRDSLCEYCKKAVNGEMPPEIRVRRFLPDGSIIWLSMVVRYLGGSATNPLVCLAMNNITEQKITEQRAFEQNELLNHYNIFLSNLFSTIPCAICQYTIEDNPVTIFANAECYRIYGYENHESDLFTRDKFSECDISRVENIENFKKILRVVKETGTPQHYKVNIIRLDGTLCPIEGTVSLLDTPARGIIFQDTFFDRSQDIKEKE